MPRLRVLAVLTAAAVAASTVLVAGPAMAGTGSYGNPVATPDTARDITAVTVDYSGSTITLTAEVEDFYARHHWGSFRIATTSDPNQNAFHLTGSIRSGNPGPFYGVRYVEGASSEFVPEGLGYSTTGSSFSMTVPRSLLGGASPIYVSADYRDSTTHTFANAGTNAMFGPVTYDQAATSVSLALSRSSQRTTKGATAVATATVDASLGGTVQFFTGSKHLGDAAVVGGTASLALPRSIPSGTRTIRAVFAPSNPDYAQSAGTAVLKVIGKKTKATLKLSKSAQRLRGSAAKATVTVSGTKKGKVVFYDGSKKLKTVKVTKGKAVYTLPKTLKRGKHTIRAVFKPTNTAYATATSSKRLTVTKR